MGDKKYFINDAIEHILTIKTIKGEKIITRPNGKTRVQKLKHKHIFLTLEGVIFEEHDDRDIKFSFRDMLKNERIMEPNADSMEIDWLEKQKTIHVIYSYKDKNVHYFFDWWKADLDLTELGLD